MEKTAENLNEIINIYGFGCEFSLDDLFNHFNDADDIIKSLKKEDLILKNQITDRYYLSDIFTCNNFLSKHLPDMKKNSPSKTKKHFSHSVKNKDLLKFTEKLNGFESDIEKIEIIKDSDNFNIEIELNACESSHEKFKEIFK